MYGARAFGRCAVASRAAAVSRVVSAAECRGLCGRSGPTTPHAPTSTPRVRTAPRSVASCAEPATATWKEIVNSGNRVPARVTRQAERFPFADEFIVDEKSVSADVIIEAITPTLTAERVERVAEVVAKRTFDVLPIVENIYDMGNLAAVCRSTDALGCGHVHVIQEPDANYKQSARVSKGAEKWLDVRIFDSPKACIENARSLGYQVVATHLTQSSMEVGEVDWTRPTAIVFGNEDKGISDEAAELADACVHIPMDGFVESYNISVAATLCLYAARDYRMRHMGYHATLTPEEQKVLTALMFLRASNKMSQMVSQLLNRPVPGWQQGKDWCLEAKKRAERAGNDVEVEKFSGDPDAPQAPKFSRMSPERLARRKALYRAMQEKLAETGCLPVDPEEKVLSLSPAAESKQSKE